MPKIVTDKVHEKTAWQLSCAGKHTQMLLEGSLRREEGFT